LLKKLMVTPLAVLFTVPDTAVGLMQFTGMAVLAIGAKSTDIRGLLPGSGGIGECQGISLHRDVVVKFFAIEEGALPELDVDAGLFMVAGGTNV
jgi:hypothetical protein